MKIKTLVSCCIILVCSFKIIAQDFTSNAGTKFETEDHDFGIVKAELKSVSYDFKVTNNGTNPLIIYNVKPSCGCTSATWTREPIPVGGSGIVTAIYSTTGSLGKFHKTLTVSSNAKVPQTVLNISGVVTTDIPEVNRLYHFSLNKSIGLKRPVVNFKQVLQTATVTETLEVANFSNKDIRIQLVSPPPFIKMEATTIPASQQVSIPVYCMGEKTDFFGAREVPLKLSLSNDPDSTYSMLAFMDIRDDPAIWKGKEDRAPRFVVDQTTKDWGNTKYNQALENDFLITNAGKSPLIIRRIYTSSTNLTTHMDSLTIAPRGRQRLHVSFDPGERSGLQVFYVSLITNAPESPTVKLILKGNINHK